MSKQTNEGIGNDISGVAKDERELKRDRQFTKGGEEPSAKENEFLDSAIKQTNENKDIANGVFGILSMDKGRLIILRPIGDGKRWLETTFSIKGDGTHKLEGSRTISQEEAKEMIDKARKEGRLIERNRAGKREMGGRELSAKENELVNSAEKQTDEIFKSIKDGKLPKEHKGVLRRQLRKKTESQKAATFPADGTLKTSPIELMPAIADSINRINGITSAQNAGKNAGSQQQQKSAQALNAPMKHAQ